MNKFPKILLAVLAVAISLATVWFFQSQRYEITREGVSGETSGKLLIYFLDVGQGDATLIRTPDDQDILIDGGPDNNTVKKLGKYLPFFDQELDLIILSHPHSDHLSGMIEILKRYKVKKILFTGVAYKTADYLSFLNLVEEKNIPTEIIVAPKEIKLGENLEMEFLWPRENLSGKTIENLNNSSIANKLIYASTSVLFMGDLEEEEKLIGDLDSDIIKIGHHGSSNANDLEFLEKASPETAIISVGENNKFGHPHYRTLSNLEKISAQILRTDILGDIVFSSDGKEFFQIKTMTP